MHVLQIPFAAKILLCRGSKVLARFWATTHAYRLNTRPSTRPYVRSCTVSGSLHDSTLRKRSEGKYFYWLHLCQYCSLTSHVQCVITQRFPICFIYFFFEGKNETKEGCSPCQRGCCVTHVDQNPVKRKMLDELAK